MWYKTLSNFSDIDPNNGMSLTADTWYGWGMLDSTDGGQICDKSERDDHKVSGVRRHGPKLNGPHWRKFSFLSHVSH